MSTVTRERLAEIKARYTAASDAPWSYDPEDGSIESDGKCGGGIAMMHPHGNINTVIKHNETFSKDDAEFIAHARTDVPDLVETLEWYIAMADALGESQERLAKELREAHTLLREAYKELNTIDAITVSPSDTDGLIELLRRIREHLGDAI